MAEVAAPLWLNISGQVWMPHADRSGRRNCPLDRTRVRIALIPVISTDLSGTHYGRRFTGIGISNASDTQTADVWCLDEIGAVTTQEISP